MFSIPSVIKKLNKINHKDSGHDKWKKINEWRFTLRQNIRQLLPSMPPQESIAETVKLRKQKTGIGMKVLNPKETIDDTASVISWNKNRK